MGIGRSTIPFTKLYAHDDIVSKDKTDPKKMRGTIFFGYNINPYAAVELGYSLPSKETQSVEKIVIAGITYPKATGSLTKQSFLVNVIGKYPITSNFFIYGKIGGIVDRYKGKITGSGSDTHATITATATRDALKFSYGAGVDYAFTKRWHMELDYYHVNKLTIESSSDDNAQSIKLPAEDVVSLRVLYQF